MNATFIRSLCLAALAPLAVAQRVGELPCHPCLTTGGCPPVDPLVSGEDHSCQNHAHHQHAGETLWVVDLTAVSFGKADLSGSQLYACPLERASFYQADLTGIRLLGCNADGSIFAGAIVRDADLGGSKLRRGYHVGADFSSSWLLTSFASSDLRKAVFTGAILSDGADTADFSNANLAGAIGLADTVGVARYSPCTDFTGTGFDPVAAGWVLTPGAELGERYCSPAALNSTGEPGELVVHGCEAVATNSFELYAHRLPKKEIGLFLCSLTPDFVPWASGSRGNLCLGGEIGTYASHVQSTGTSGELRATIDLTEVPAGLRSAAAPGETWYYQAWFRETGPLYLTSNFTDAVAVTFD